MAKHHDLFARRNQARITTLVVLATLNYMLALALAAVAIVLTFIVLAIFNLDILPDSSDGFRFAAIAIGVIIVLSFVGGLVIAVFRIPFARRNLERQVLRETGATISKPEDHVEVRNLLEGLAIAADIPPPRFAFIDDPAPNSFGVGTRPAHTIVGVTKGLVDVLSRDELEAILAYEVSRIGSWDVALSSWTVALTGGAISATDSDDGLFMGIIGYVPRRVGEWLQVWSLRGQGAERDRTAVQFTRNPKSLIDALEKLDANTSQVSKVSRTTAPLWVEFPAHVVAGSSSRVSQRLGKELLLDERIEDLKKMVNDVSPRP
jgi:heat shock protein HtpX